MTTQNTLNNTILSIAAQATKLTGERQEGLALTKFYLALEDGKIVFDGTTDNFTVNGIAQNTAVAIASFYSQAFDNKTGLDVPSLIKFSQAGVCSTKQFTCLESEAKPTVKKPLHNHVLTGSEFFDNSLKEGTTFENISLIYNQLESLSDKNTKADILAKVKYLLDAIIPPARQASITILLAKEAEFAKRFEALSTVFTDIKSTGSVTTGNVTIDNIKAAVELLTVNGLELYGTPTLDADFIFKVSFREIDTTTTNNI